MKLRRCALCVLVAWGGFAACGPSTPEYTEYSETRLLDQLVRQAKCNLEGNARLIEGPTQDSLAIELGPGASKVSCTLSATLIDRVDALMRGEGAIVTGAVPRDYAWSTISFDRQASLASVEVVDGSHLVIADFRTIHQYEPANCE